MQEKKANLKERHQMHSQIEELEKQNRAMKEKIKELTEAINRDSSVQEDKAGQELVAEGPEIKTYNLLQLLDLDHELNQSEEIKTFRNSNRRTSRQIAESNFYEE
jgi:hypothetical protein